MTKNFISKALKILSLALVASAGFNAGAVSTSEMDQARAIAAKFYIRFADNGAGYLDNWTPSSMSDLEAKLANDKDRNLLSQIKSIPLPSDFASWDKAKLAEYWGGTFFTDNLSKLDESGASNGLAKKQIRDAIGKMQVSAPQPETPAEQATAAPDDAALSEAAAADAAQAELATAQDAAQAAEAAAEDQEEIADAPKPESSGTWVYVMILAILIGVVIFLVVYASRTMKGQPAPEKKAPAKSRGKERPSEPAPAYDEVEDDDDDVIVATPRTAAAQESATVADDTKMREKYAGILAAKAEEIRVLTRQLSEMEGLTASLKEENRRLQEEVEALQNARDDADDSRRIFLGRVNSRGVFVRADRHAVDGQSIYVLTTTSPTSGKFKLISNPVVAEQVLDDPAKWLSGGCFARDIYATEGHERVVTEVPGTAVFSDGAWRVEQKAKIRYQ